MSCEYRDATVKGTKGVLLPVGMDLVTVDAPNVTESSVVKVDMYVDVYVKCESLGE